MEGVMVNVVARFSSGSSKLAGVVVLVMDWLV